jgi:uncharacterized pyridoxal phosphate-containing UPF0001 family protein
MMAAEDSVIAANLERLRERVARAARRAGRRPEDVTIVAVSKTFPAEAIRSAYHAGLRHFGENRVQEWESKQARLADLQATWHLIGHLQSNKARRAAHLFDQVLIEVRLGDEATKSGVAESDLPKLAEDVAGLAHLELLGLMTIPPFLDEPEEVRSYFARLRELRDRLVPRVGQSLPVLSMGMSHDFQVAIEEGATEIRIGTALFGVRKSVE